MEIVTAQSCLLAVVAQLAEAKYQAFAIADPPWDSTSLEDVRKRAYLPMIQILESIRV